MKNSRLYFPVLRNKRAEWAALAELPDDVARRVVPIFEPLPLNIEKVGEEGVCDGVEARMREDWKRKIYIDAHNLNSLAAVQLLSRISRSAIGTAGRIIPVLRPDLSEDWSGVLCRWAKKIGRYAVRIEPARRTELEQMVQELGVDRSAVTLLLDMGIIGTETRLRQRDFAAIAGLDDFRDVVLVGGAFPKNLTGFKVGQHQHPRHDWLLWRKIQGWTSTGMRQLKFGDYTIQHPVYEEPKAEVMNVSASIRYTSEDYWVIMRGEGIRNPGGAGAAQWPANATLLTERPEFKGADYSYGDAYIASKTDDYKRTGNPETWIRAGINHHITLTVRQLETISGS